MEALANLEEGYYWINGTKRILYWNGSIWMKPTKDNMKRYSGLLCYLENQPNIKSVQIAQLSDLENKV